jgi:hypothetical protein
LLEQSQVETSHSRTTLLTKYFLHGLIFSLLLLALEIVWAFLLVFLVLIGYIVGLILGLIVLFFIVGGLNAVLTQSIWDTYIKQNWKSLLGHGIVLFIALILAAIPSILIRYTSPSLIAEIFVFFIYCFVDGYIAKQVGFAFEEDRYEDETLEEPHKWQSP